MSAIPIDSMHFMPSDVARLVLGYLLTKKYVKTYKMLIHECNYLEEYLSLKRKGMNPPLTVYGLDLEKLLDDYAALKAAENQRYDVGTDSLWKQFDILTESLKAKTSTRQLKLQGDNQSTRMRRMLADNRKKVCLRRQLRSVQNKLRDNHVSPDSNSKSPETAMSKSVNFVTTHSEEDVDNIGSEDNTTMEDSVAIRSFNDTFTTCTDSEVMEVCAASPMANTTSTVTISPVVDSSIIDSPVADSQGFTTVRDQSVSHPSRIPQSHNSQIEENSSVSNQTLSSLVVNQVDRTEAPVLDPDKISPTNDSSKSTEKSENGNINSEKLVSAASRSTGRRRRGRGRNSKADTPTTGDAENKRVTRSAKKNLQFPSVDTPCVQTADTSTDETHLKKDDKQSKKLPFSNEATTTKNALATEIPSSQTNFICDIDSKVSSDKENPVIGTASLQSSLRVPALNIESSKQLNQASNSHSFFQSNSHVIDHTGDRLRTTEPSCSVTNVCDDISACDKQSSKSESIKNSQEALTSCADGGKEKFAQNVTSMLEPNVDHLNRRKRNPRKKQGSGKFGDRKNLLQNENSNDTEDGSRLSSVYDSNIPTFYEQILNNPLLHEKLAENINKQLLNNSLNKSKDRSTHNASVEVSAGPSQLSDSVVLASDVAKSLKDATEVFSPKPVQAPDKQMSNSLNTDLHDILDLHETRMSEGTVNGILDMTKSDPLFESLFNLFAPYSADPDTESNLPQKIDFSGITLEMGKEAKAENSKCTTTDKVRSRHNTSKNSTANISMPSFTDTIDCPEPSHTSSEENLIMEILQSPQVNSSLKPSEDVEMTSPDKEHILSAVSLATTTVSDSLVSCVNTVTTVDNGILPLPSVVHTGMAYTASSENLSVCFPGIHTSSTSEVYSSQQVVNLSHTESSSVQPTVTSSHTTIETGVATMQSSQTLIQSDQHNIHSVASPAVYDVVSSSPFHSPIMSACSPVSRTHKIGEMGCMSRSPLCGDKLSQLQEKQEILISESRSECDKPVSNTDENHIDTGGSDKNLDCEKVVMDPLVSKQSDVTSSSSHEVQRSPVSMYVLKSSMFTDKESNDTDSDSLERFKATVTHSDGLNILSLKETNIEKSRKSNKKSKSRSFNSSNEDNGPKEISYTAFLNEVQEAENSSTPVVSKSVAMTTQGKSVSPQECITNEMMSFVTMLKEGLNPKRNNRAKTPKAQAKKGRKRNEDKMPKPKVLKDQWSPDLKALVKIATAENSPKLSPSMPKENKIAKNSSSINRKSMSSQEKKKKSKGKSPDVANVAPNQNKVFDEIIDQTSQDAKFVHRLSENEADQSRTTSVSIHSLSDSRSQGSLMEVSYLGYETEKVVKQKDVEPTQNEDESPIPRISLFKTSTRAHNSQSVEVDMSTGGCKPNNLDSSMTSNEVESPKSKREELNLMSDQLVLGKSSDEEGGCSDMSNVTSISSIKMALLNKLKKSADKKLEMAEKELQSAIESVCEPPSQQTQVHLDQKSDETDGIRGISSVEGENNILSMPTLDSLITDQVSIGNLDACSTDEVGYCSKVAQEQSRVFHELSVPSSSVVDSQVVSDMAQPGINSMNHKVQNSCVVQKETDSERDYSKILYSENQDFLELGSPGRTMDVMDCNSSAINTTTSSSISASFSGATLTKQPLASDGIVVSKCDENVIDIHFCSPEGQQHSAATQNIIVGGQIVGNVPVNTIIQNTGGNSSNANPINTALPQQIIILPPQQDVGSNVIDINLPAAVSSATLQPNYNQSVMQKQVSFNVNQSNAIMSKNSGNNTSMQSAQQIQVGDLLAQDYIMSERCRDAIAQYNAKAQVNGDKLIAVPVGLQLPNKNLHVKSLNFGPEAEEKVRQVGYGRGRKKSVEEKKARKGRSIQNMQNWRKRQKAKDEIKQKNEEKEKGKTKGKKSEGTDLIPDKSLKVFMKEGDITLKDMPKTSLVKMSSKVVESDDSDFIPDNSGMVFLNQNNVAKMKVPTTARQNVNFRKTHSGKSKFNSSPMTVSSPLMVKSIVPESFSETPSSFQPQLLSKKLLFSTDDQQQDDQFSSAAVSLGNYSATQNFDNSVIVTNSSVTAVQPEPQTSECIPSLSVLQPLDLKNKGEEQGNSDDSDVDVDSEWQCPLTLRNGKLGINNSVCDQFNSDTSRTTEHSALPVSVGSFSDKLPSLKSSDPSRRCSGNNSLFSIQCNYGDSSDTDSATEEDRPKFSSQNQNTSNGCNVVASSNTSSATYGTGATVCTGANFEKFSGGNGPINSSSNYSHIQATVQAFEKDNLGQCSSHSTVTKGHVSSPCSSVYSDNYGPRSVESVTSSMGASPWSSSSINSPSNGHERPKSRYNLMMTPPKKRITATLKNGEGFYYYHSSSSAKVNSPLPVSPEKQDCESSLSVLTKSPKTPKGKRTPMNFDSVRRSPRLVMSPQKTRSYVGPSGTGTPGSEKKRNNLFGVKRAREESSEQVEQKSKKAKSGKKTVDLGKVDLDKFLSKIHKK